eukprot:gene19073-20988_t
MSKKQSYVATMGDKRQELLLNRKNNKLEERCGIKIPEASGDKNQKGQRILPAIPLRPNYGWKTRESSTLSISNRQPTVLAKSLPSSISATNLATKKKSPLAIDRWKMAANEMQRSHSSGCMYSSSNGTLRERSFMTNANNKNTKAELYSSHNNGLERKTQEKKYINADVSPITNRRKVNIKKTPQQLPNVLQLKLKDRRRSVSLHNLTTEDRAALEIVFQNFKSLSEWSNHWRQAREGEARRKQGLPSIIRDPDVDNDEDFVSDISTAGVFTLDGLGQDDAIVYELEPKSPSFNYPKPSLEDRLAFIERAHGIQHNL